MRLETFEMIDAVEALDLAAGTIRTRSVLPDASPVFDGHFPHWPILPGVMMLEAMNHAAGFLVYWRHQNTRFVFLGSIKRAKFRRFVKPGTTLTTEARLTHEGSGFCILETTLTAEGDVAADAEVVMIIADFPNQEVAEILNRRSKSMLAHLKTDP
jgi:3-hydroxyacyl-[acyl-carrier-protein] dehydratase